MQLPAEKQSTAERFSVILLVASGRGDETRQGGSNCHSLIVWLGQAVVEDDFQRGNSFMELSYQEPNFVLLYLVRGKF